MKEVISYVDYLKLKGYTDSISSYQWWKMEVLGMSEREAIDSSIQDYAPLPKYDAEYDAYLWSYEAQSRVNNGWIVTDRLLNGRIPFCWAEMTDDNVILSKLRNRGWIIVNKPLRLEWKTGSQETLEAVMYLVEADRPIGALEFIPKRRKSDGRKI